MHTDLGRKIHPGDMLAYNRLCMIQWPTMTYVDGCSRAVPLALGNSSLYRRTEGTVGFQRESLHQLGHIQRNVALVVSQYHHVSASISIKICIEIESE